MLDRAGRSLRQRFWLHCCWCCWSLLWLSNVAPQRGHFIWLWLMTHLLSKKLTSHFACHGAEMARRKGTRETGPIDPGIAYPGTTARLENMNSQAAPIADDDVLRPSLYDATPEACFELLAGRASAPDEQLMLSLILDAVIQLQRRSTTSAATAARWIRGERGMGGEAVSFRVACATLRIDADYLARGLLRGVETRSRVTRAATPRRVARRRLARRTRPARHHNPVVTLWFVFLAAVMAAPLWARLVIGTGLAGVGVGCLLNA
jgi:hypothetical protein